MNSYKQKPEHLAKREIRVFISSTFRDMQAERDHLVRFVFPRLRQRLLPRGIHLEELDLRWGILAEDDPVVACRELIDQCHPRFLCILGERYGSVPDGKTESITADEVCHAAFSDCAESSRNSCCFFYFRDENVTDQMVEKEAGEYREAKFSTNALGLDKLKQRIRQSYEPRTYTAQWSVSLNRLTGLEQFGEKVEEDLLNSISEEFGDEPAKEDTPFSKEEAAIEGFVSEQCQGFWNGSRDEVIQRLMEHSLSVETPSVICVTGDPGIGKSAMIAEVCRRLHERHAAAPDSFILLSHFVDASAQSSRAGFALRYLCHELLRCSCDNAMLPERIDDLSTMFLELLERHSKQQQVVILLDGLEHWNTSAYAGSLSWLWRISSPQIRVIVSSLPCTNLDVLRSEQRAMTEESLGLLSDEDTTAICSSFLGRFGKRLNEKQTELLMSKREGRNPLFLLTALDQLRTRGDFHRLTDDIEALPETTAALFDWVLSRFEKELWWFRQRSGQVRGEDVLRAFVCYLALSRRGMSHFELTELLDSGDSLGNVAALEALFRPFLQVRGDLLAFKHVRFAEAVRERYLQTSNTRAEVHHALQVLFLMQADPSKMRKWNGSTGRAFSEVGFHLFQEATETGNPDELFRLADDKCFRMRQFERLCSVDSTCELLNFCLVLATRNKNLASSIHFSFELSLVVSKLCQFFGESIRSWSLEEPDLAMRVCQTVPRFSGRMVALAYLAWIWATNDRESAARRLLGDMSGAWGVIDVEWVPLMMLISKDLVERGFDAGFLFSFVPLCPFRMAARQIWYDDTPRDPKSPKLRTGLIAAASPPMSDEAVNERKLLELGIMLAVESSTVKRGYDWRCDRANPATMMQHDAIFQYASNRGWSHATRAASAFVRGDLAETDFLIGSTLFKKQSSEPFPWLSEMALAELARESLDLSLARGYADRVANCFRSQVSFPTPAIGCHSEVDMASMILEIKQWLQRPRIGRWNFVGGAIDFQQHIAVTHAANAFATIECLDTAILGQRSVKPEQLEELAAAILYTVSCSIDDDGFLWTRLYPQTVAGWTLARASNSPLLHEFNRLLDSTAKHMASSTKTKIEILWIDPGLWHEEQRTLDELCAIIEDGGRLCGRIVAASLRLANRPESLRALLCELAARKVSPEVLDAFASQVMLQDAKASDFAALDEDLSNRDQHQALDPVLLHWANHLPAIDGVAVAFLAWLIGMSPNVAMAAVMPLALTVLGSTIDCLVIQHTFAFAHAERIQRLPFRGLFNIGSYICLAGSMVWASQIASQRESFWDWNVALFCLLPFSLYGLLQRRASWVRERLGNKSHKLIMLGVFAAIAFRIMGWQLSPDVGAGLIAGGAFTFGVGFDHFIKFLAFRQFCGRRHLPLSEDQTAERIFRLDGPTGTSSAIPRYTIRCLRKAEKNLARGETGITAQETQLRVDRVDIRKRVKHFKFKRKNVAGVRDIVRRISAKRFLHRAIGLYNRALEHPSLMRTPSLWASLCANRGLAYELLGKAELAKRDYETAIERNPHDPSLHERIYDLYMTSFESVARPESIQAIRTAVQLDPTNARRLSKYAMATDDFKKSQNYLGIANEIENYEVPWSDHDCDLLGYFRMPSWVYSRDAK